MQAAIAQANGGDIVDDPVKPTKLTLDTPEAKEAFQWFVDLQNKHHVVANQVENSSEQEGHRHDPADRSGAGRTD